MNRVPLPELQVIPRSVLQQAKTDAGHLADARQKAERLLADAEARAVKSRDEGFQAGWLAAQEEMATLTASTLVQLDSLRDGVVTQLTDILTQALQHVLNGPARENFFATFLDDAQRTLGHLQFARLRVHPDDEASLQAATQAAGWAQSGSPVSVEVGTDVAVGDCALVSQNGKVAVSLSLRLDDVRNALNGMLHHGLRHGSQPQAPTPKRSA